MLIAGTFLLSCLTSNANHIVGGAIAVTYNGAPNSFHIKLNFYRDCNSGGAGFDPISQVEFGIYDLVTNVEQQCVNPTTFSDAILTLGDACFTPGLCVEHGTYEVDVTIPNNSNGYYVSYNRCCRNVVIINIANPSNTGDT